jgi:hypothetical protein
MSEGTEIHAGHPLFLELRKGLLWHRTSINEFHQIRADGFIKPNAGAVNRWGSPYACQQLGGVSLFDFTAQPKDKVLGEEDKWQQFLGDVGPVTVVLGLNKAILARRLVPYPANKEKTTGNVIPWVEVCHRGPIPFSAIVSYLLVCAVDYSLFEKHRELDEPTLARVGGKFSDIVLHKKEFAAEKLRKINDSVKVQLEQVQSRFDQMCAEMRRQK